MKLKLLQEIAAWERLSDKDFRQKVTNTLLKQEESIDKLFSLTTTLLEENHTLKQRLQIIHNQNIVTTRRNRINQKTDDDNTSYKQKASSRSVS
jgi:hypothetical protein